MSKDQNKLKQQIIWQVVGLGFLIIQVLYLKKKDSDREHRLEVKRLKKGFKA